MKTTNESITVYEYDFGIKLVAQEQPIRLLYLLEGDRFVTNYFVSNEDVPYSKNRKIEFLHDDYSEKNAILFDYPEEALQKVLDKLAAIEKHNYISKIKEIVDGIENDFTDRRGLRQEWESSISSEQQQERKHKWSFMILSYLLSSNVNDCVEEIPYLIKYDLLKINCMYNEWATIDCDIQEEILEAWKNIASNILK